MKVQHTLRAFTAKDRKAIKMAAENYPISDFYKTDELITSMGIGEAAVTALNEKDIPTPLVVTFLRAPRSRMHITNEQEIEEVNRNSKLIQHYNQQIDRESAYEMLNAKLEEFKQSEIQEQLQTQRKKAANIKDEDTILETIVDSPITRQIGRTVARELTRGLLGVLGLG